MDLFSVTIALLLLIWLVGSFMVETGGLSHWLLVIILFLIGARTLFGRSP